MKDFGRTIGAHSPRARGDHEPLGEHLGLTVRPDPVQAIVLDQRVVIGHAVHRGRRHVDQALDPGCDRGVDDDAGAVEIGRPDILGRVQRQRRRGVDDDRGALDRARDRRAIADVAVDDPDPTALGIVERREVERRDVLSVLEQPPDQVDPEEARTAGDEVARHQRVILNRPR